MWFDNQSLNPGQSEQHVQLITYGVPRSATTLVFRIAGDVLLRGVVKTHDWLTFKNIPIIASYRDLRDCVVSHWRYRYPEDVKASGVLRGELLYYLASMYIKHGWTFDRQAERPSTVIIRYEDFINDLDIIFDAIAYCTGSPISADVRNKIGSLRTLAVSRDIMTHGRDPMMMDGHIHEGSSGEWKRFVDDETAQLLTEWFSEWLIKWGYLKPDPPPTPTDESPVLLEAPDPVTIPDAVPPVPVEAAVPDTSEPLQAPSPPLDEQVAPCPVP